MFVCFFETGLFYVAETGLEFAIILSYPSVEIMGMSHNNQCKTVVLHSLSEISHMLVAIGSVSGDLFCLVGEIMVPRKFMVLVYEVVQALKD